MSRTIFSAVDVAATTASTALLLNRKQKTVAFTFDVANQASFNCTATLQVSNASVPGATDWVSTSSTVALTSNGDYGLNVADLGYRWVRINFVVSAGEADIVCIANVKRDW